MNLWKTAKRRGEHRYTLAFGIPGIADLPPWSISLLFERNMGKRNLPSIGCKCRYRTNGFFTPHYRKSGKPHSSVPEKLFIYEDQLKSWGVVFFVQKSGDAVLPAETLKFIRRADMYFGMLSPAFGFFM
jgi:hypothetical protein